MLEYAARLCEQSLCVIQLNNNLVRMWTLIKHGAANSAASVPFDDANAYAVEV